MRLLLTRKCKSLTTTAWSFLCLVIMVPASAAAQFYSGTVTDERGNPVQQAIVKLQGTAYTAETDVSGKFRLEADEERGSRYITAWKQGFFNGGTKAADDTGEYKIVLAALPSGDNREYQWIPSLLENMHALKQGKAEEKICQSCHPAIVQEWQRSSHAKSASNPLFLSFFTGMHADGMSRALPGYKEDFPKSNGNCTACHVPMLSLSEPKAGPQAASAREREGIACDFCHKIREAKAVITAGYPGVQAYELHRPSEGHQVFYGPYPDVFPGDDSFNPEYRKSRYCAPCHNGRFWEVLAYSEFDEWADSSYAAKGVQCQDCHMKPDAGRKLFALAEKGGVQRVPGTIPSHEFSGVTDRDLMQKAIACDMRASFEGDDIAVDVTVANRGAGHHYPTGSPMRHLILLVEAVDEQGIRLPYLEGEKVPSWGGRGPVEMGNYAGLPGKGFAKVLRDTIHYPASGLGGLHFRPEYPAPHWRPAAIESDNRLPANGSDRSTYRFKTEGGPGEITVIARLVYRRAYKQWLDAKGFELSDMVVAEKKTQIRREQ